MNDNNILIKYKRKKILVTGGAGAIGVNLVKVLATSGAKRILVLDDFSSGIEWGIPDDSKVEVIKGSITDEMALKSVFTNKPDIIFHLAALFANQNSIDHPEKDLEVNGLGTLKLLKYANAYSAERFIYASSSCVYGNSPLPLGEDAFSLELDTPYAITKLLGEQYCKFFFKYFSLPTVILRYFNSYGPGEIPGEYRNVIPNFIYWALQKQSLPITGTGEETRDFTFVEDIVDGTLRSGVIPEAIGETVNLASGRETKIIDLANMINELVGNDNGVKIVGRRSWDKITRRRAYIDKAKKLVGYTPTTEFEDGLTNTIEWFKENWDKIGKAAKFGPEVSSAVRDAEHLSNLKE